MYLSDLSIRRPVLAAVAMLVLVTVGIFSYRRLALDFFPNIDVPVLLVTTRYPGASPESIEREVSKRIEDAVNTIPGIRHVSSTSVEGSSLVVAEFQLEVRINDAAQDARAKIAAIRGDLPQAIEEPVIQKVDFGAMPVVSLAVRSSTLPPRELSTLVEKRVKKRIESVAGVGKVELVGLAKREIAVEVDPRRLEALGMGVDEVIAGLQAQNVNTPLGRLTHGGAEYPLRVAGKPATVEGYAGLVVAERGGRPVPLGEVAAVVDGVEEQRTLALVDGVPAVGIDVQKQSGTNTVGVVDAVLAVVERLKKELPAGTEISVVRDASLFIRESVDDVRASLVEGAALTILIVFLFLASWRSTVITGLTLPIAIISAFISIYFLGMTLNVITLMALSLAVGMLIDDAIVVRENIVRHLERGKDHHAAAREGTSEIGLAVLSTTLSVIAVFVPVAFMKGVIGRIFYSFGLTVAFAVAVSLLVSFSLDPMLSSRWRDPDVGHAGGRRSPLRRLLDSFNRFFERLADAYRGGIGRALDHPWAVLGAATAAFVAGLVVMGTLESNFAPVQDRGEFQVTFKAAPTASLAETRGRLEAVLAVIRGVPEVDHTYATIGANETTVRDASVYVHLVGRDERARDQFAVQSDLRGRLKAVPGIRASFGEAGSLNGGQKPLQVNLRGEDLAVLRRLAASLKRDLAAAPGIVDLEVSPDEETPEYRLAVDQERAVATGVSTADLVRTVGALVGGQAVTTFEDEDGDAVSLRVRLPAALRGDATAVERLRLAVRRPGGPAALVPVGEVATWQLASTPAVINRRDLARQVVVSANVDGVAVGTGLAAAQAAAGKLALPAGYSVAYSGDAEIMVESFGYLMEALLLAIIFVYLILAAQFESFVNPLAIMFSLPLSLVGMAGMLALTRDTISIMSLIGLIMLMGLVTKNAILLVDYAKTIQRTGVPRREALVEAGRTRLRPIMMTTLAMIFGMLPLALGLGAGAELRAPMARAVIGGLLTSTLLTLFVVPVVYELLDDAGAWLGRRRRGAAALLAVLLPLAAAAAALPRPAAAQEAAPAAPLTREDARRIALERGRDVLRAAEYGRSVQGRYLEERAAAFPQLTATAAAAVEDDRSLPAAPRAGAVRAELGVTQPVYTWGRIPAAIRAAKVGLAMAGDRARQARLDAVRGALLAFDEVLLADELRALAEAGLAQKERLLGEARRKLAAGTATDYDVLAAEVAVANARPGVVRAQDAASSARERLRFVLDLPPGPLPEVQGSLAAPLEQPPPFEEALAAALARRADLAELRNRRRVADEVVTITKAGAKPRLDAQAGAGWRWLDTAGAADDGPAWSAGLVLTWPLLDGRRTAGRVMAAESDAATLAIAEGELLDAIALEARGAVDAVREAVEIAAGLAGTVAQAERLLAMAEKGFELGVKTRLDVDDAQLNLTLARGNLARARRDYLAARAQLAWVDGSLVP